MSPANDGSRDCKYVLETADCLEEILTIVASTLKAKLYGQAIFHAMNSLAQEVTDAYGAQEGSHLSVLVNQTSKAEKASMNMKLCLMDLSLTTLLQRDKFLDIARTLYIWSEPHERETRHWSDAIAEAEADNDILLYCAWSLLDSCRYFTKKQSWGSFLKARVQIPALWGDPHPAQAWDSGRDEWLEELRGSIPMRPAPPACGAAPVGTAVAKLAHSTAVIEALLLPIRGNMVKAELALRDALWATYSLDRKGCAKLMCGRRLTGLDAHRDPDPLDPLDDDNELAFNRMVFRHETSAKQAESALAHFLDFADSLQKHVMDPIAELLPVVGQIEATAQRPAPE